MCELNVIFHENGEKKVLMEDVVKIKVNEENVEMIGILGDVRSFKGRIIEIDTTRDEAVLEPKTEEEISM